ncbi:MAG TPA: Hsp20/alpha crystallin family protein [Gemmatimonadaceae bacterium]|nr:Hsp20/alpha crystallin family protein [Gemmatimonadaceae bacterium]
MLYRTANTSPVFSLRHEIDRLFEDTFGATSDRRSWLPAADVRESADGYTFELELPGLEPDQVDVTADNGVLTVRGEKRRTQRKEGEEDRYHIVERSYGSFVRAFQLPQGVEEERITADFRNGVLAIHVPKPQRPQPRRIQIGGGEEPAAIQNGARSREGSAKASRPAEKAAVTAGA